MKKKYEREGWAKKKCMGREQKRNNNNKEVHALGMGLRAQEDRVLLFHQRWLPVATALYSDVYSLVLTASKCHSNNYRMHKGVIQQTDQSDCFIY